MSTAALIMFRPQARPAGDVTLFHTAASSLERRHRPGPKPPVFIPPKERSPLTIICVVLAAGALLAAAVMLADTFRVSQPPAASPTPPPSGRFTVSVGSSHEASSASRFRMATVEIGSRESAQGKLREVVRNGPKLMQGAKRNAVAAASECLGRPVQARIDSGRVLGASGGLLFALAVLDELTPGDLTGGREVTGTGAISATGRVGPVLQIENKVKGVERERAELFLVPYEQLAAAKKAARSMSVAGVHDLSEALTVLTGAGCNAHAPRA